MLNCKLETGQNKFLRPGPGKNDFLKPVPYPDRVKVAFSDPNPKQLKVTF